MFPHTSLLGLLLRVRISLPLLRWCCLCLAINVWMSGQEVNNNRCASSIGEPCTSVCPRCQKNSDNPATFGVKRTPTTAGPCGLINGIVEVGICVWRSHMTAYESLRRDRHDVLKREACEGYRTSIWPFISIESNRRDASFCYFGTRKRVIGRFTDCQVQIGLSVTIHKGKRLERYGPLEFPPAMIGNVCCWGARMPKRRNLFPVIQNVPSGNESAKAIHKETSANSCGYMDIVILRVGANNRNNRELDTLYCLDGHVFRRGGDCYKDGAFHGGHGEVSDSDLKPVLVR